MWINTSNLTQSLLTAMLVVSATLASAEQPPSYVY